MIWLATALAAPPPLALDVPAQDAVDCAAAVHVDGDGDGLDVFTEDCGLPGDVLVADALRQASFPAEEAWLGVRLSARPGDREGTFEDAPFAPAVATTRVYPDYPREAAGREPPTIVCDTVVHASAQGSPTAVKTTACPEAFARSSEDAVGKWTFTPATVAGRAVASALQFSVSFKLK